MGTFKTVNPAEFQTKPVHFIGHEWFLLTAGTQEKFNTMTCAWGGIGFLWNRPVVYTFVRPQRYTFEFTEKNALFTMCFFGSKQREALNFCGTHSGRDEDKIAKTGLTPMIDDDGYIFYEQAETVLKCRKLFATKLDSKDMVEPEILAIYPQKDFHTMYIGQIDEVLVK